MLRVLKPWSEKVIDVAEKVILNWHCNQMMEADEKINMLNLYMILNFDLCRCSIQSNDMH